MASALRGFLDFCNFGWIQISNFWMDILTRAGREWGGLFSRGLFRALSNIKDRAFRKTFHLRFLKGL